MSTPESAGKDAGDHTPGWPCGGRIVCPACAARNAPESAGKGTAFSVLDVAIERELQLRLRSARSMLDEAQRRVDEAEKSLDDFLNGRVLTPGPPHDDTCTFERACAHPSVLTPGIGGDQ